MQSEVTAVTFGALPIIVLPFLLILIVLVFITLNRYIRYKERVALAQLGFSLEDMIRAEGSQRRGSRGVLWGGVITAMSGLALLLGLATLGVGAWLLGGLLPLFVGLGMVLIYFATLGAEPTDSTAREAKAPDDPQGDEADSRDDAEPVNDGQSSQITGG